MGRNAAPTEITDLQQLRTLTLLVLRAEPILEVAFLLEPALEHSPAMPWREITGCFSRARRGGDTPSTCRPSATCTKDASAPSLLTQGSEARANLF